MPFAFEWDEEKRQEIIAKRGVDILRAARMFNDPEAVEIWPDPRDHDGEQRINAIGPVGDVYYNLVYADRGESIRLITAWKLNEKSRKKAQARYARRAQRHGETR